MSKFTFSFGATVALNAPANSPFPICTTDLYQSTRQLAALGFDTIEYHIRDPKNEIDPVKLKQCAVDNGLAVSSLGTGMAYGAEGLSLISPDDSIRQKAIQRLKDHVDAAEILGAYVVIGSMRGIIGPDQTFEDADARMQDSMRELADYACKRKVTFVIEAIDRFETNYIHTAAEDLALINRIGKDNVAVHLDSFHMNIEERSWDAPIRLCGDKLKHVHLSDNMRNYPGYGHIPFEIILRTLKEIHYQDSITMEHYPYPDSETSLREGLRFVKTIAENLDKAAY